MSTILRKYTLCGLFISMIFGCATRDEGIEPVQLKIVETLVIDTANNPTIAFIIKATNYSNENIVLGNNHINDDSINSFLEISDTTNSEFRYKLPSLLNANHWVVKKGSSRHMLFPFSIELNTQEYVDFKSRYSKEYNGKWPFELIGRLAYSYNSTISEVEKTKIKSEYDSVIFIEGHQRVDLKENRINYYDSLLQEEAFIKIIRLDSLSHHD